MATSSSDGSCTAPADFPLSSELEEVSSRISQNLSKCPLCHNSRRIFHCRQCVQNGDFVHSTSVYSERFADKQLRLMRLKAARSQLEERCMKFIVKQRQKDKLTCDINTCKERISLLQQLVNETKQSIGKGNQRLNRIRDINVKLAQRLPREEETVQKMHRNVIHLRAEEERRREAVEEKKDQLKKVIRTAAKQLIKYIFPMGKVQPGNSSCSNDPDASTDIVTCELAEASGTSYVRGKWINESDNTSTIQHCIVSPTLPGNGDYSAYSLWVAANKDSVPGANKENAMHNPAYNISAALTYATQLVNIIAYYLNVRLPYKLLHGEFCGNEMSDQKFAKKVARLNSNVLHLCFTQNTDLKVLHPMYTLQNLMHLLNTDMSDLGRIGPVEVDSNVMEHFHGQLAPDLENNGTTSDEDEEEDVINCEWEAVPNIPCPEMQVPIPGAMSSQQSSSLQANQSIASGLVTSAAASLASIWRGWTTNK